MKSKLLILTFTLALLLTSACSSGNSTESVSTVQTPLVSVATQASQSTVEQNPAAQSSTGSDQVTGSIAPTAIETHENAGDYTWDADSEVAISLEGSSISASSAGVKVNGSTATIIAAGTYRLRGSLDDGQILVDTDSKETIRLILAGVTISNSTSAAIDIENAEKVIVILADGTQNVLSDAQSYTYASADVDEPNAALFSKTNLTIYGGGSLEVRGNYNDAISSKDGLIIKNAAVTVASVDDGIRGKDYLVLENATLNVTSEGDGLKSDNDAAEALGTILVTNSSVSVDSGGDGISAEGQVEINSGIFTILTDSGSSFWGVEDTSAKGIKGNVSVLIHDGSFSMNTADDAIHSNGSITINGGTYALASGDDGMHADTSLTINNGQVDISTSYEGLESAVITINGGTIHILASDDGINVASGADSSGFQGGFTPGGMQGGMQGGGRPGDQFAQSGDYWLYINGGYIYVNAAGDGIDVNGSAQISGGTILVDGPTESMNGPIDYLGSFSINGGIIVASGSAGMAQSPSQDSTQPSILLVFDSTQSAGTLFSLQTESGETLLSYAPAKSYQSILVSSAALQTGETVIAYLGGSSTGKLSDGLYTGGSYTQGSQYTALTLSSTVTTIGSAGGFGVPGKRR